MTAVVIPGETELGGFARLYSDADWAVFPVWGTRRGGYCTCRDGATTLDNGRHACSRGKHPMVYNGVLDATRDMNQIITWWQRWPWANIGLPAGANQLAILDVDPHHGGRESWTKLYDACRARGIDLLDTLHAVTGSGGLHVIFAAPENEHAQACGGAHGCPGCIRNGQGQKRPPFGSDMPGIDTRGHGGYIVAPPSRHASGGVYEFVDRFRDPAPWPAFLTALMNPPRTQPATTHRPVSSHGYGPAALASECQRVRDAPKGEGNHALFLAACRMAGLIAAGHLTEDQAVDELVAAATAGRRRSETEARKTIQSGLDRGRTTPRGAHR